MFTKEESERERERYERRIVFSAFGGSTMMRQLVAQISPRF
jgi:hypothetical protein